MAGLRLRFGSFSLAPTADLGRGFQKHIFHEGLWPMTIQLLDNIQRKIPPDGVVASNGVRDPVGRQSGTTGTIAVASMSPDVTGLDLTD
ncbi:hypothetical protein OHD62_01695 [Mesorhizobium sp. YC-39]|uniref:hypothetical protein n=1 Tax=unclassified Mesorhizobium TaxID=325217 RepID=UPI0021E7FA14|nr:MULTISPECIES: hypothetical protein [unclassified Mesorhizobium]MCV3206530.1 hypothetical protein [Mesorhizobium sp. YC-2]MCV3227070.1 hypothetical protein [Mesorhizobium sp. YC-39]